jgi:hypothetical protein
MAGPEIAIIEHSVMALEGRSIPIPEGLKLMIERRRPIPVAGVETYQVTLPEGYVREGNRYVFRDSSN